MHNTVVVLGHNSPGREISTVILSSWFHSLCDHRCVIPGLSGHLNIDTIIWAYMWAPSANGPEADTSCTWYSVPVRHAPSANGSGSILSIQHHNVHIWITGRLLFTRNAPGQQQTETTAVYTMYKQRNIDRIVHEGVIVSVHEREGIKCAFPLDALAPFAIGQQGVTITVTEVVVWPVICEMVAIQSQWLITISFFIARRICISQSPMQFIV